MAPFRAGANTTSTGQLDKPSSRVMKPAAHHHTVDHPLAHFVARGEESNQVRRATVLENCKLCQHAGPLTVDQRQSAVARQNRVRLKPNQAPPSPQLRAMLPRSLVSAPSPTSNVWEEGIRIGSNWERVG